MPGRVVELLGQFALTVFERIFLIGYVVAGQVAGFLGQVGSLFAQLFEDVSGFVVLSFLGRLQLLRYFLAQVLRFTLHQRKPT